MNQVKRAEGGGGGGGVDVDEVIQQLESDELRKNIRKQFSKKKKALGELKGRFQQHSEEKIELRPLSSTKQVLIVTQFQSSNEGHI